MVGWRAVLLCGCLVLAGACARGGDPENNTDGLELTPVFLPSADLTTPPQIGWILSSLVRAKHAKTIPSDDSFLRVDGQLLALAKGFLNTPFVLLPTLTESTVSPEPLMWMSTSLVSFQRIKGGLQLVESAQGKQGHTTNRTPQILATFPIVRTTAREIIFDFQAGALSDLFLIRSPFADAAGANSAMMGAPPWTIMSGSYIRSSNAGDGWFSVEQVVSFSNVNADIGTVFRFTFWRADQSTMTPLPDDPHDDIGYFNIETFKPGNPEPIYIARRWRSDRSLTLYLSANTPARFRGAIRDGVLAWNAIFGREFLQVADAPAGVQPGDPRFPLIQWVEHATGLGIGMSQSHPVTGEQLTALITLREGWATLHDVDHLSPPESAANALPFTLNGFVPAVQCANEAMGWDDGWMDPRSLLTAGRDKFRGDDIMKSSLDSATKDRLALLQLRAVVMHEVGHVLGLRHNFAGSLDNAIDPETDADDLAAAVDGSRTPDAPLPSSSIMDYLTTPDDIRMTTPGRYDAMAIGWAYDALSPINPLAAPHYCTDEDRYRIADCARRDSGREPLDWWGRELETLAHSYSAWLIEHVVISPAQMDPRREMDDTQAWILKRIGRAFSALYGYTPKSAHSWIINDQYLVERAPRAKQLIAEFSYDVGPKYRPIDNHPIAFAPDPSLADHPFVRSPLREKILDLETLASNDDPKAAWAAQVLQDLTSALQLAGGGYGYMVTPVPGKPITVKYLD